MSGSMFLPKESAQMVAAKPIDGETFKGSEYLKTPTIPLAAHQPVLPDPS